MSEVNYAEVAKDYAGLTGTLRARLGIILYRVKAEYDYSELEKEIQKMIDKSEVEFNEILDKHFR